MENVKFNSIQKLLISIQNFSQFTASSRLFLLLIVNFPPFPLGIVTFSDFRTCSFHLKMQHSFVNYRIFRAAPTVEFCPQGSISSFAFFFFFFYTAIYCCLRYVCRRIAVKGCVKLQFIKQVVLLIGYSQSVILKSVIKNS